MQDRPYSTDLCGFVVDAYQARDDSAMIWWPPSLNLAVDHLDVEAMWVVWQYKNICISVAILAQGGYGSQAFNMKISKETS